jgi:glycosyltransferase involved in cell wall biosynthesis
MNIGYTLHFVRAGKLTGIERYSLSGVEALARHPDARIRLRVLTSRTAATLLPPDVSRVTLPGDWRLAGEQIVLPVWSRWQDLAGLHVTAFGGAAIRLRPFVLTVYDTVFWDQPDALSLLGRYYYKPLVERALRSRLLRGIVCISGAARDALLSRFPGLQVPVEVVYPAPGTTMRLRAQDQRPPAEAGYTILSVGTIEPRKNLPGMARAVQRAREQLDRPIRWIHAGRRGWLGRAELDVLNSGTVEEAGPISDAALRDLIESCHALLSLSLLEGFNLPLSEALACGRPAVVSDLPVHREVAASGALYVPLDAPEVAARELIRLLRDTDLWTTVAREGWTHAQRFTAARMATGLAEIYAHAFG